MTATVHRPLCRSCRAREVMAPPTGPFVGAFVHQRTWDALERAAVEFDLDHPACLDWLKPDMVRRDA